MTLFFLGSASHYPTARCLCSQIYSQVDYFLGIQILNLPNGSLLLSQTKYILNLLTKASMQNVKGISSPMVNSDIIV